MDKNKLREIIFGYRTKAGKTFDVILLSAIIISVICVMLDSDKSIHKEYGPLLLTIEWIFTIFFTIEYALRIYCTLNTKKYIFSFMGIIDLLSILPTYLIGFYAPIGSLIDIRIMRLIRVFRIFKFVKLDFLFNNFKKPVDKLSTIKIFFLFLTKTSATCDPMYPAPPVIRIFFIIYF